MDALKLQLLRIREQLSALTATQKMLTASLVAIMIMTVLWWGRYAGTAEMEAVMDRSLSPAEMGQVKNTLDSRGIPARIVGDRVMVPSDRKVEAFVTLAYTDALPSDASSAWDEMFKQMSPWDSKSKTDSIQNHFREQMVSRAIASFIPGVAKANVIITPNSERRIGGDLQPVASVHITTRGDVKIKQLVDAAASTVASAVTGLSKSRVSVVIDGIPRKAHESDGTTGGDQYEQIEELEKKNTEKILALLPQGSLVAVNVQLDTSSSQEHRETIDPSKTITKERVNETTSDVNEAAPPAPTEPGALPNTTLSIGAAPAQAGGTNTSEKSRIENEVLVSKSVQTINKPAGMATVQSASVRLPRSAFVARYKAGNPSAKAEPDDNALQPLVTAEVDKTRQVVRTTLAIESEKNISVDVYFDNAMPALAAGGSTAESSGSSSGMGNLLSGHAKEIVLGALAVVSLFMVSTMVRRSTPQVAVAAVSTGPIETPRLATGEAVAGIVGGDGNATLDGMELDEEAVKSQQMVEQVSTMVKENPDAAANLVKRWLNR